MTFRLQKKPAVVVFKEKLLLPLRHNKQVLEPFQGFIHLLGDIDIIFYFLLQILMC